METIEIAGLPPGSQVRGTLYADTDHAYGLGDVMEVELPNGLMIDVSWDDSDPEDCPFLVVVYCGNAAVMQSFICGEKIQSIPKVASTVQRLAREFSV